MTCIRYDCIRWASIERICEEGMSPSSPAPPPASRPNASKKALTPYHVKYHTFLKVQVHKAVCMRRRGCNSLAAVYPRSTFFPLASPKPIFVGCPAPVGGPSENILNKLVSFHFRRAAIGLPVPWGNVTQRDVPPGGGAAKVAGRRVNLPEVIQFQSNPRRGLLANQQPVPYS